MVFPVPRTWSPGQLVDHDMLNVEVRDPLKEVYARVVALEALVAGIKTSQDQMLTGWTPYTPVLTGSTTNPVLGTGSTATGGYKKTGRSVIGWCRVAFGSANVGAGSGRYYLSLPTTPVQNGAMVGAGHIWDNSGATLWTVTTRLAGTKMDLMHTSALGRYYTSNIYPMIPGPTDTYNTTFAYEAVS